jgi:hypothetical protein
MTTLRQVLERPWGLKRQRRRSVGGVLREIHHLKPEVIIVPGAAGCVEVSLPLLFELFVLRSRLNHLCSHEVTVPRRGWVVLVPRLHKQASP